MELNYVNIILFLLAINGILMLAVCICLAIIVHLTKQKKEETEEEIEKLLKN